MPILPHNFPTLRRTNGDRRPSVLLIGAGMSFGLAPRPGPLLDLKRDSAERELGVVSNLPRVVPAATDDLYKWADEVFSQLAAGPADNPKLRLAESLGISKDAHWAAPVHPANNTPRHRVIARFAREGMWKCIWSLNWDFYQESALINVGVGSDNKSVKRPPWPVVFSTFVTAAECPTHGVEGIVHIVKPHGCVMAIVEARKHADAGNIMRAKQLADRFLITQSELDQRNKDDGTEKFVFHSLCAACSSNPFVVAGWSASEQYILKRFEEEVRPALAERQVMAADELSIVDITLNAEGHTSLAQFYGKTGAQTHIPVEAAGLTTDQLMLWVQGLYALDRLVTWSNVTDKPQLEALTALIEQPPDVFPYVITLADAFLPAWVRLCWQLDLVRCLDTATNQPIRGDQIAIDSPNEHIPWQIDAIDRRDLQAASRILAAIERCGHADSWNFARHPGALYRDSDNVLVVLLPAWIPNVPNDLRGLRSLADAVRAGGSGFVRELWLIPVHWDAGQAVGDRVKQELKASLATSFRLPRFAADKIILKDLTDL
jgi:hypothetical protein